MARKNRTNNQTPTSTDNTNMTDEQLQPVSDVETETELTTETVESTEPVETETPAELVVAETVEIPVATASEPIETSIVETPAPVVVEPVVETPVATEPVVVVESVVAAPAPVVATPDESIPAYLRAQRDRLTEYAKYMNLETLVSTEIVLQQQNLFRLVIQSLLRLRGMEFVTALDELLVFIKANRSKAFHEKYAFREYPNLKISKEERTVLVDVVHLLINICDPDTRRLVLSQIDLSVALNGIRDFDEVRALFHEYITR